MLDAQMAARQYAVRPKDESFETIEAFLNDAIDDQEHSREVIYNLKDLRIVPREANGHPTIKLASPKGEATIGNWAFKAICRTVGAPAGYMGELPVNLTADCLNYGLQSSGVGTTANLLVRTPVNPAIDPLPFVRACTTEKYGRLFDAQYFGELKARMTDHDANWQPPMTWSGKRAGLYRGGEDSFVILTNGGSIVEDPTITRSGLSTTGGGANVGNVDGRAMYRGIMVRNSEVGKCAITIEEILFRCICGNHLLWGAILGKQYRRRHVGKSVLRDTIREIQRIAFNWANQSTGRDNALIRGLIDHELAHTKEAIVDELKHMGATAAQALAMYERCEATEDVSPRSFWGLAQGATRASQDALYQNERYELDRLAAAVMARGAKLVRV